MQEEIWNSWTCSGSETEFGSPMLGNSTGTEDGSRVWRRPVRRPWLERAFHASLAQALEHSMAAEPKDGVRMELVERVRAEIAKGAYRVSAQDLADKLIRTMRGSTL